MHINIYFSEDSKLVEFESISRDWRGDIHVKIKDNLYHVEAYTIIRLKQDFEQETDEFGFYNMYPNIFLVKECSKLEIIKTINNLYEQGYFDKIKPENLDISGYVQVQ